MGHSIRGPRPAAPSGWELAAETIAVKIRWFGLLVGYVLVNVGDPSTGWPSSTPSSPSAPSTPCSTPITACAAGSSWPLSAGVSLMEALFIGLLCYFDGGLESPFRYYYFLSLICCAIRHPSQRHLRHLRPALPQLRPALPGPAAGQRQRWCRSS